MLGSARGSLWLLGLLVAALLPLAPLSPLTPAARADPPVFDGKEIKDLCTISSGGQSCPVFPPPPSLINPGALAAAGPEVAASLERFSEQAIDNVRTDYGLPESDHDAVLAWGRADAQARLWALITEAVQATEAERSPDQQNAAVWMMQLANAQANDAAMHAGAQYTKWAGLNLNRYWQLARDPSTTTAGLTTFLAQDVRTYDPNFQAGFGYCQYVPPAPYSSEDYDGSDSPNCFNFCPSIFGCPVPTPEYDDFVDWGSAAATYANLNDAAFVTQASYIATAEIFGTAVLGAAVAAGLASTLGTALASTAVAAAIFPYATSSMAAAGAGAGVVGAAAAAVVVIVIIAVVIAILEGIRVFTNLALPGEIADLVIDARTQGVDPSSLITTTEGATSLFNYYVGATLPIPRNDLACDNSLVPPWAYTSSVDPNLLIYVPLGTNKAITTLADRRGCLNPPPIPPASDTDPDLLVTTLADPDNPQIAPSISVRVDSDTTQDVRLTGTWFVQRTSTPGSATTTAQSLRLTYRDWDDVTNLAWLMRKDDGTYVFVGYETDDDASTTVDADTCADDGTCWLREEITYKSPSGQLMKVSVQPPPSGTVGRPTWAPDPAVEGDPVTLSAGGFAPAGAVGTVTHSWRVQRLGCGHLECLSGPQTPSYDGPFTGDEIDYTWQSIGPAKVELTATDAQGRAAQTLFVVNVGNVPPTALALRGYETTVGNELVLQGVASDAGEGDDLNIAMNLGDGTLKETAVGQNSLSLFDPDITRLRLGSQAEWSILVKHTYTEPGIYYGTVTVSDWGGGTDFDTFVVRVTGPQQISFPAIGDQTYGDVVTMKGTGTLSGNAVTYTAGPADVCTATGVDGAEIKAVGVGQCTVTAHQAAYLPLFLAAPDVTRTFDADPALLVIMVDDKTKTYGDADPAFTATYDGFANGDDAGDLAGLQLLRASGEAVGDYRIRAVGASNPHYVIDTVIGGLQITPAPLTITADDKTRTYGGDDPAFTASMDGLVNGDTVDDVTGLAYDGPPARVGVGDYAITPRGATSPNYDIDYVDGTLEVTPAGLTITADDKTQVYGDDDPDYTATFDGLVNGDSENELTGLDFVGPPNGSDVGEYDITPSGVTNPDYDVDFVDGTQRVIPAPLTITADDKTKTYGAPDPDFTASFDGLVNGDVRADVDGLVLTGPPTGADAGEHDITASGATSPNYDIDYLVGTETILPAPLTIRPVDVVGASGTIPVYPWHGDGWVNGDRDLDLFVPGRTPPTCAASVGGAVVTPGTPPGAYARAVGCSGAHDPNYDIGYSLADLRVDPVVSLAQVGLSTSVAHVATFDGSQVPLPLVARQVPLGSTHSYAFPEVLVGPAGTTYVTRTAAFSGSVSTNVDTTASYRTMGTLLQQSVLARGLTPKKATKLAKAWGEVREALDLSSGRKARRAVRSFADLVRADTRPGHLSAPTAQALLDYAQAVHTHLRGSGSV